MTLTEFLLARISEDQARADEVHNTCDDDLLDLRAFGTCTCREPARRLAQCDANRRIVERCGPYLDPFSVTADRACTAEAELAEDTLRDIATVYAEHPDYREEWRP